MPADLSTRFRDARAGIDVPAVPRAVLTAARTSAARNAAARTPRSVRLRLVAASLAALSLVAVAAAAELVIGPQITLSRTHGLTIGFDRLPGNARRPHLRPAGAPPPPPPSPADVRAVARAMNFPVTLPAGVPGDGRPTMLMELGSSGMVLDYNLPGAWRRDNHVLQILLADPHDVAATPAPHAPKHKYTIMLGRPVSVRWRIGGEDVVVMKSTLTPAETEHLHHAMLDAAAKRE